MKDIGVASSDIYANRYNRIRPQTDSIGVTIGMKKLADGRILIPVAIRGSNYEREWTSNVTLGESGEAQGFSTAAGIVFSDVKSYIARKIYSHTSQAAYVQRKRVAQIMPAFTA